MSDNQPEPSQVNKPIYQYRSNNFRTNLITYTFSIYVALCTIALAIGLYFLYLMNKANELQTEQTMHALVKMGNISDKYTLIIETIFTICAIIFPFWIYRASNNSHALHAQKKFEFTTRWCVGSYFIPIMSFFWPYKAMMEIWLAETVNNSDKDSDIIAVCWIALILDNFIATLSSKMPINTVSEIQEYIATTSVWHVCGIISAIAAIKIVRAINKAQASSVGI